MNYYNEAERLINEAVEALKKSETSRDYKQGIIAGMLIAYKNAKFIDEDEGFQLLMRSIERIG